MSLNNNLRMNVRTYYLVTRPALAPPLSAFLELPLCKLACEFNIHVAVSRAAALINSHNWI